jgi:hypothetical protein
MANAALTGHSYQFAPSHEDKDLADGKTAAYLQALEVREGFRGRGLGG